ncbi:MAG: alpha-galactosidase [Ruminococcaceae bacterium]|nr:alpha-galactosidase [Oscillospiraceae bacterium]
MKFTFTVNTTSLGSESISLSSEQQFPVIFSAKGLDFTVNRAIIHSVPEYTFSFVPSEAIPLHSVTVTVSFADNTIGEKYPLYLYDNSLCTNTFAMIKMLDADSGDVKRSRELVMLHNGKGDLCAAFTTYNRFYTEFRVDNKAVTAFYALEDKEVKIGEEYVLESLVIDDTLGGIDFFDTYADIVREKYSIGEMKPIPAGWSSWSCLYGEVTEDIVAKQAELVRDKWLPLGADLIQIDDGWQKGGSFGGYWTNEPDAFAGGIPALREKINALGLRLGLWMSPGLIVDESEMFDKINSCLLKRNGKLIKSFGGDEALSATKNGSVYSLDIGKEEVLGYIREIFTRGRDEYGAVYFKVDFIMNLLLRLVSDGSRVEYENGYAVELYRRYVGEIRKTVGEDIFLLACGAPIGESVGIFDSVRISPDITWAGASSPNHYGPWNLVRDCAVSAFLRSPMHNKLFINDPDALLVRDFITDRCDDGLSLTYEEAKMWATVVAMSGGHILLNEEIDRLPEERQSLFTRILPSLGIPARPTDFYEFPYCTETYIDCGDARLVALYNWCDEDSEKIFKNPYNSPAVLVDCWSGESVAVVEDEIRFTLSSHTTRAFLVRPLREGFLWSDGNFYLGISQKSGREYHFYPSTAPDGFVKVESSHIDGLYVKE